MAYYAYRLTRGAVDDPALAMQAFENALALISIERTLGLFVEPTLQAANGGLLPLRLRSRSGRTTSRAGCTSTARPR